MSPLRTRHRAKHLCFSILKDFSKNPQKVCQSCGWNKTHRLQEEKRFPKLYLFIIQTLSYWDLLVQFVWCKLKFKCSIIRYACLYWCDFGLFYLSSYSVTFISYLLYKLARWCHFQSQLKIMFRIILSAADQICFVEYVFLKQLQFVRLVTNPQSDLVFKLLVWSDQQSKS